MTALHPLADAPAAVPAPAHPLREGGVAGGPAVTAPAGGTHAAAATAPPVLEPQVVVALGRLTVDLPLRRLLQEAVDLAARVLPEVDGLCLALAPGAGVVQAAFAGAVATVLDERQFGPGPGPGLHAARTGRPVELHLGPAGDDHPPQVDAAWEDLAAVARRRGVRCVSALPVQGGGGAVGWLTLHLADGAPAPATRAAAEAFVDHAGGVLVNAALHAVAQRQVAQLQEAMASRAVIEQAKGVLMASEHLDADAAFDRLARDSQDTNTKLRTLAADVVDRAVRG